MPSLIVDFVHVHPALVKLALNARADAVLVTDAVATEPPVVEHDGAAYLADGTLAGSTLTMDVVLRNVTSIGVPIAKAVRHVTANPARALGLTDRGRIAAGTRPTSSRSTHDTLEVRAVWVAGRPV